MRERGREGGREGEGREGGREGVSVVYLALYSQGGYSPDSIFDMIGIQIKHVFPQNKRVNSAHTHTSPHNHAISLLVLDPLTKKLTPLF